ncbi:MAG: CPBP family intramembrane metalloprotease [Deltaproteobacteria bacterium]|nr:CPBP family intramembrane metalloprotease [Deltaproteobacteria bacterium]MBW2042589.1 CPBP family intramembrane metalloprotease [Deltaproteobacteria bacterium]MBW2133229.1 CPBP family intramembrane metalloprotease [Deltaproteobacteria bacterium]
MTYRGVRPTWVWITVALAAGLWGFAFYLTWLNFWIKIPIAAATLAVFSLTLQRLPEKDLAFDRSAVIRGIASAVALYFIFWLGKTISLWLFPFAPQQIGAIYGKGQGFPMPVVFFLLLFVTGPCEEIYWRGFLQRHLVNRYGKWPGWGMATGIYAGVHIWSFNFMLIGAAAVAGAFWGYLYLRWGRLSPVIVSHALWSAFVFAVVPIP